MFSSSQKCHQMFRLLLKEFLLPRSFKNCIIWSHCFALIFLTPDIYSGNLPFVTLLNVLMKQSLFSIDILALFTLYLIYKKYDHIVHFKYQYNPFRHPKYHQINYITPKIMHRSTQKASKTTQNSRYLLL